MSVDVLFVAWNRRAFTEASFEALVENTDWALVDRLCVHDDASVDGTTLYLRDAVAWIPDHVQVRLESKRLQSPVAAMNRYLANDPADWFCKIDNDAAVPAGWLEALLAVRDITPDVDLVGMEAGMTAVSNQNEPWDGVYRFHECTHIGGIGLMRTGAFGKPMVAKGRFGFGDYQVRANLNRGWVTPDLPLVLLDRLPFDPWASLSDRYVEAGWQRPWRKWDPAFMRWAWEWFSPEAAVAA